MAPRDAEDSDFADTVTVWEPLPPASSRADA